MENHQKSYTVWREFTEEIEANYFSHYHDSYRNEVDVNFGPLKVTVNERLDEDHVDHELRQDLEDF